MKRLVLESWLLLLRFEWIMRLREFAEIRKAVQEQPIPLPALARQAPKEELCRAMDYACVLYLKPVLCLQRSAATTILLRRHGWRADLVIGAQIFPFKSHAWCEFEGLVVNDKPYVREIYEVLERC